MIGDTRRLLVSRKCIGFGRLWLSRGLSQLRIENGKWKIKTRCGVSAISGWRLAISSLRGWSKRWKRRRIRLGDYHPGSVAANGCEMIGVGLRAVAGGNIDGRPRLCRERHRQRRSRIDSFRALRENISPTSGEKGCFYYAYVLSRSISAISYRSV